MPKIKCGQAAIIATAMLLPILLVAIGNILLGIDVPYMTRDVSAIGGIHPLAGFLSSFGILLWCASAAIWFFSAHIHFRRNLRQEYLFALSSGAPSAYFALDDLFQIHESLAPRYLGLPETGIYALIAIAFSGYVLLFQEHIRKASAFLLVMTVFFLAASVVVDLVPDQILWRLGGYVFLLEDGLKWLGIVNWFSFCVSRCEGAILEAVSPRPERNSR